MQDERQGLASWFSVVRLPEFPVEADESVLVIIDMTYQQASRHHGICKRIRDDGYADDLEYYMSRIEQTVVPSLARLADGFRAVGAPVIYTRCASLVGDGSDQTWRHRAFGLVTTVDSKDAQILDEIAPRDDDVVLNKTGSSVFNSTNLAHICRNMGRNTIVVTGIFTNSCVEGTTRDGGDLDFRMILVEDACAAMSPLGHRNALEYLDKNFCHVKSTDEVLALVGAAEVVEAAR